MLCDINFTVKSAFGASVYLINEQAQNVGSDRYQWIEGVDPYASLPDPIHDVLINYASTASGSYLISAVTLAAASTIIPTETKKRTTGLAIGAATLSATICVADEYADAHNVNTNKEMDYGDVTAIGLGIACFAAVVSTHVKSFYTSQNKDKLKFSP